MLLGLDLGTTNVKAVVIDPSGRVAGQGAAAVGRYCTPDGGVEQDIGEIWSATCEAMRQAAGQVTAGKVRAIGVSSQGGAVQLLDGAGKPLGRVISWLDGRGRPYDERFSEEVGTQWLVEHLGCNLSSMTIGQMIRLAETAPELLRQAQSVGFVGDVIVGRLGGRRAHDPTSLSIAMLYNPRLRRADTEILRRLGIRESQLPTLLPATTPAGRLLPGVADLTGLPAGIPVSPAIHDQYAASTGGGSVGEGDVCLGTGTAWVLVANAARLSAPVTPRTFVGPHPVEGLFGHMLSMVNGGSALDWLGGVLGRDRWPAGRIDDAMECVPAGCDGLCFWPLVSPGSGTTAFGRRGGRIEGLGLAHRAEHLLRAVVEGLACELARHLQLLANSGLPVRRLFMCGTAATSRVTPQVVADVTRRPVTCIGESAISALGAAVIARAMVEQTTGLAQLARSLAPQSRTVEPCGDEVVYRDLLARYLEAFC